MEVAVKAKNIFGIDSDSYTFDYLQSVPQEKKEKKKEGQTEAAIRKQKAIHCKKEKQIEESYRKCVKEVT